MNGFRMPRKQVEEFLTDLHTLLNSDNFDFDHDFVYIVHPENDETLARLGYSSLEIPKVLKTLTVSDYSETLLDDRSKDTPEYLFVFGKNIRRVLVYIKIKMHKGRKVICISFHKANSDINRPYMI